MEPDLINRNAIETFYFKSPSKDGFFDPKESYKKITKNTLYVLKIDKENYSGKFAPIPTRFVSMKILKSLKIQYKALEFKDNYLSGNIIKTINNGTVYFSNSKWMIGTSCLVQIEFEYESVIHDFFEERFLEIKNSFQQIEDIKKDLEQLTTNNLNQDINKLLNSSSELLKYNETTNASVRDINDKIQSFFDAHDISQFERQAESYIVNKNDSGNGLIEELSELIKRIEYLLAQIQILPNKERSFNQILKTFSSHKYYIDLK
jgi:methyl-accepting chemotaxis protein